MNSEVPAQQCAICGGNCTDANYWHPGPTPYTAIFELTRYIKDHDDQEMRDNWERTFRDSASKNQETK